MFDIRLARPEDVPALAEIGARTFVETFVEGFGIPYPEKDIAAFIEEAFSERAIAANLADPAQVWWVGLDANGAVAGFAQIGPCALPHPDANPENGELKRLYIARSAQGLGLGRALLETALAGIAERFSGPQWIGVWSGNDKAVRLYARYGFEKAGEYRFAVGDWLDDEFILRRN